METMRIKFVFAALLFLIALGSYFALAGVHDFEYNGQVAALGATIVSPFSNTDDLLPDIVPLPARDISIETRGGEKYLRFSTTYFNQGEGPLDFVADPTTRGIREDVERNVFQHVHKKEGGIREINAGTFEWHEEHLHFHFSDFVLYQFKSLRDGVEVPTDVEKKATFCVRDVSKVFLDLENTPEDAEFKICLRERQGVSVGWGDTYLDTYPDQDLPITDLPSGEYELSFLVNPKRLFEELDYTNNRSVTKIFLDMEKSEVKIITESPLNSPEIEHVYLEQPFGEGN